MTSTLSRLDTLVRDRVEAGERFFPPEAERIARLCHRMASRRSEANAEFFAAEAERLAGCCHLMAERFARGRRLLAAGASPAELSDARHVAVEFVHPLSLIHI